MNLLRKLDLLGKRVEDFLLFLLLAGMILLATGQIALRNFFAAGVIWGDELLRIILLWLALFGAMAASRDNKHINIDIVSRFLPRDIRPVGALPARPVYRRCLLDHRLACAGIRSDWKPNSDPFSSAVSPPGGSNRSFPSDLPSSACAI